MGDPWNDAIALHAEAANRGDKVAAKTATRLANAIAERDAEIRRLTARVAELEEANDAAERDVGYGANGNLWRWWRDKAREHTARAEAAEAERDQVREALASVREEICIGPVDDVLWHTRCPAVTTVDFISTTLGDDWDYDEWLQRRREAAEMQEPRDE